MKRRIRRNVATRLGKKPPADIKEPQPKSYKLIYQAWGALMAITICLGVYFHSSAENRVVYNQTHNLQPLTSSETSNVVFTEPIELEGRRNLQVSVSAPVDNSWAWVGGDFINEESGMVEEFELPIEYYYGVEGGESWSEGDKTNDIYISSLPAGRYTLRLEFQWEHFSSPLPITVTVTQGIARTSQLVLAMLGISIIPIALFMNQKGWWDKL
ncbi:MAG TPA: hypothetical protein VJ810_01395 [Blastocatellia bacterium]|nr:hypothetical protein [Blastocatellia bacterium]